MRAGEHSRSDPATIRAGESVVGPYAVIGEGLDSARVDVESSEVAFTAVTESGDAPAGCICNPTPWSRTGSTTSRSKS
ncbi:hypothetical protein ACFQHN_26475 [Natrialbaceae archaeon GCM10025896]